MPQYTFRTDRQTHRPTDGLGDRSVRIPRTLAILIESLALSYSNTTVYYEIHEHSECILVDCGVTNLIHDRRSCVDFTLEVEANVARCVHSGANEPGVKRNSGLSDVYPLQTLAYCGDREKK